LEKTTTFLELKKGRQAAAAAALHVDDEPSRRCHDDTIIITRPIMPATFIDIFGIRVSHSR
jgi:hypothetical protein